jgi:aminoglycoside phosphotransferase (APT) family kinase protein
VPCDPRQPGEIATATLEWIRDNVPGATDAEWDAQLVAADAGMTTFIWFGQLRGAGLPEAFRQPLALRVFGNVTEDVTLERERGILGFVAARDYPAPVPLAAVPSDAANPVGLPWMILPKVSGAPLLEVIAKAPWAALRRLRELAGLQAWLHGFPVSGCPLPSDGALVDRWLTLRSPEIESVADARAAAVLTFLRERADIVRSEVPVVCHGDFHPLNVLSSRDGSRWRHVVIDWTDAMLGDHHFDVARTLGLFRVAAIAASSPVERVGLRVGAPGFVRTYRRAYERIRPLDDDRLAYWTAAHFLRGWTQITQLHEGAFDTTRADVDAIPISVADAVLERAEQAVESLRSVPVRP